MMVLTVVLGGCERGHAFTTTGTTTASPWKRPLYAAIFENPELNNYRKDKLGSSMLGRVGGIEKEILEKFEKEGPQRNIKVEECVVMASSPEVADYLARQKPSQPNEEHEDSSVLINKEDDSKRVVDAESQPKISPNDNNSRGTFFGIQPTEATRRVETTITATATGSAAAATPTRQRGDDLWAEQVQEQQVAWDEYVPRDENKAEKPKEWSTVTSETTIEKQQPDKQSRRNEDMLDIMERLQLWKQAKNVDHEKEEYLIDEPSLSLPQAVDVQGTTATSESAKKQETFTPFFAKAPVGTTTSTVRKPSTGPDDDENGPREQHEMWKRERTEQAKQVNVIQEVLPSRTISAPSSSQTVSQRRQIDPAKFKNPDQTIIVQAVRNDGRTTNTSYTADFVSGRAEVPRPPTTPPPASMLSRPFFVESPPDLFFIDIGDAAMIKLALEAQQSYYNYNSKNNKNQGVADYSTADGQKNWESGPYEYQVTTPELDQHKSWLGSLLGNLRISRQRRTSDRIVPRNPKDEYTEFAIRRMPSGTSSSRRRYERLLQRSSYRSPYAGYDYPRSWRSRIRRDREDMDNMFPSYYRHPAWTGLPPPLRSPPNAFDNHFPHPQRRQRRRSTMPPPPPPHLYPQRRFYDLN